MIQFTNEGELYRYSKALGKRALLLGILFSILSWKHVPDRVDLLDDAQFHRELCMINKDKQILTQNMNIVRQIYKNWDKPSKRQLNHSKYAPRTNMFEQLYQEASKCGEKYWKYNRVASHTNIELLRYKLNKCPHNCSDVEE